ncbi:MAG TPA: Grx4 family monothiol glutaredoxin [Polyangiaceae bacterium LLY-WYZ-14_1]|nr:Grx4 family monothiol glutaredoxin [Polyangiaceae bacterium LLY-WYZ-14_1]
MSEGTLDNAGGDAGNETRARIEGLLGEHPILLFMKGTKHFPQCGFSATVVEVLKRSGVPFESVNVLADPAIRSGIKAYANWPTIPQLYLKGEFVGGCDIIRDMYLSGELAEAFRNAGFEASAPGPDEG